MKRALILILCFSMLLLMAVGCTSAQTTTKPTTIAPTTTSTGTAGESIIGYDNYLIMFSGKTYLSIEKAGAVTIDGQLGDWDNIKEYDFPYNVGSQVRIADWGGIDDISGKLKMAYDDEKFYIAMTIKDDVHSAMTGENSWMGDGIQVAFSKDGATYSTEYGFSYVDGAESRWAWAKEESSLGVENVDFKCTQNGDELIYELAIPWLAALPGGLTDNVRFSMLVNENDGAERRGWIELSGGIGISKNADEFATLLLRKDTDDIISWMYGPQSILAGATAKIYLNVANMSAVSKEYSITIPSIGVRDASITVITVPAGKIFNKEISVVLSDIGDQTITSTITDVSTSEQKQESYKITVIGSAQMVSDMLDEIEEKLPALEALLNQCKDESIAVDYETVNITVIKDFLTYCSDSIISFDSAWAEYVAIELDILYNEAYANLNAYLDGSKTAMAVPRYVTDKFEVDGSSILSKAVINSSGAVENSRPTFFIGYGHFLQAALDIPKFQDFGNNTIQNEVGLSTVILEDYFSESGFRASSQYLGTIEHILNNAADNNISVNLLLSAHYFPEWAYEKWNLKNDNPGFIKFNINDPKAKEIMEAFLRTTVAEIKDYKSLQSLVLSNEPHYDTRKDPTAVGAWHEYLEARYSTVSALNLIYGSDYTSFNVINMPATMIPATPAYYDWVAFNNKFFADWHRWVAEIVKEEAPNIPIHSKLFGLKFTQAIDYGTDPEDFADFCDFNGNDNFAFIEWGSAGFLKKNMQYDMQMSFKEAPIANTEDHIIMDRNNIYVPGQVNQTRTDLWQGAVHGRAISNIWVWERTTDSLHDFAGSVLHRPDVVSGIGKINLDLNRLAYEVTAVQKKKADVAILYSVPSMSYNTTSYMDAVEKAYEALTYSGQKVRFVSERQIKNGGLDAYKILIVPQATNVTPDTLSGIKEFIDADGKVIILGDASLGKDDKNQDLSAEDRTYVFENSKVIASLTTANDLRSNLLNDLKAAGLIKALLVDADTDQPVYGVEWTYTEYSGNILINVANYEASAKNVKIQLYDGIALIKTVDGCKDLITGNVTETSTVALDKVTPYLFSIDTVVSTE